MAPPTTLQENRLMHPQARRLQLHSAGTIASSASLTSGSMLEEPVHHNRSLSLASGSMLEEQVHRSLLPGVRSAPRNKQTQQQYR
jgi:hypothetical protein